MRFVSVETGNRIRTMKSFNRNELELPPDKSFGLFFAAVIGTCGVYFSYEGRLTSGGLLLALSLTSLVIALRYAHIFRPLNFIWMKFGLIVGRIVSPIVLGLIFFGVLLPTSLFMRCLGRDELRLRRLSSETYWLYEDASDSSKFSFTRQF